MCPSRLHETIVNAVVEQHGASRTGFARAVRKLWRDPDPLEIHNVPDAWKIDGDMVTVWEVNVTGPLTDARLAHYAHLWFDLDCESIDLELYEVDRYGTEHLVYLTDFWFSLLPNREENACAA